MILIQWQLSRYSLKPLANNKHYWFKSESYPMERERNRIRDLITFGMTILVWFLLNLEFMQSQMTFVGKEVCVFKHLITIPSDDLLMCALQCNLMNYEIFHFNTTTLNCSFYIFQETCESRNKCNYVRTYFNNNVTKNVRYYWYVRLFMIRALSWPVLLVPGIRYWEG